MASEAMLQTNLNAARSSLTHRCLQVWAWAAVAQDHAVLVLGPSAGPLVRLVVANKLDPLQAFGPVKAIYSEPSPRCSSIGTASTCQMSSA